MSMCLSGPPKRLTAEEICQHLEYELPVQVELINAVNAAYWEVCASETISKRLKTALHALLREGDRLAVLTEAVRKRIIIKEGP